jgi:hypothetical protein
MKVNERLRDMIFQVIDNQIAATDPAETAIAAKRLRDEGYSEFQAKQLIGQALAVELFDAMKNRKPFDNARYVTNLRNLPREPVDKID